MPEEQRVVLRAGRAFKFFEIPFCLRVSPCRGEFAHISGKTETSTVTDTVTPGCGRQGAAPPRATIGEKYVLLSEVLQERLQQRTMMQIIDVSVPQVVIDIEELVLIIFSEAHLGAYRRTDRRGASASDFGRDRRVQRQTVEQIVDMPIPQMMQTIVEVVEIVPRSGFLLWAAMKAQISARSQPVVSFLTLTSIGRQPHSSRLSSWCSV